MGYEAGAKPARRGTLEWWDYVRQEFVAAHVVADHNTIEVAPREQPGERLCTPLAVQHVAHFYTSGEELLGPLAEGHALPLVFAFESHGTGGRAAKRVRCGCDECGPKRSSSARNAAPAPFSLPALNVFRARGKQAAQHWVRWFADMPHLGAARAALELRAARRSVVMSRCDAYRRAALAKTLRRLGSLPASPQQRPAGLGSTPLSRATPRTVSRDHPPPSPLHIGPRHASAPSGGTPPHARAAVATRHGLTRHFSSSPSRTSPQRLTHTSPHGATRKAFENARSTSVDLPAPPTARTVQGSSSGRRPGPGRAAASMSPHRACTASPAQLGRKVPAFYLSARGATPLSPAAPARAPLRPLPAEPVPVRKAPGAKKACYFSAAALPGRQQPKRWCRPAARKPAESAGAGDAPLSPPALAGDAMRRSVSSSGANLRRVVDGAAQHRSASARAAHPSEEAGSENDWLHDALDRFPPPVKSACRRAATRPAPIDAAALGKAAQPGASETAAHGGEAAAAKGANAGGDDSPADQRTATNISPLHPPHRPLPGSPRSARDTTPRASFPTPESNAAGEDTPGATPEAPAAPRPVSGITAACIDNYIKSNLSYDKQDNMFELDNQLEQLMDDADYLFASGQPISGRSSRQNSPLGSDPAAASLKSVLSSPSSPGRGGVGTEEHGPRERV